MTERFARVCPTHRQTLEELPRRGLLRCPREHQVTAWLVVDLETGDVLGAGRDLDDPQRPNRRPAVFLGPRLQLGGDVLLDLGVKRYALPLASKRAAA